MTEQDKRQEGTDGEIHLHYSEKGGHLLRGEHQKVTKRLGGVPPEFYGGYDGIEAQRRRRGMRRVTDPGKK